MLDNDTEKVRCKYVYGVLFLFIQRAFGDAFSMDRGVRLFCFWGRGNALLLRENQGQTGGIDMSSTKTEKTRQTETKKRYFFGCEKLVIDPASDTFYPLRQFPDNNRNTSKRTAIHTPQTVFTIYFQHSEWGEV